MAPHLDALVSALLGLLRSGPRMVQEGALTALASAADAAKASFDRYYDEARDSLDRVPRSGPGRRVWVPGAWQRARRRPPCPAPWPPSHPPPFPLQVMPLLRHVLTAPASAAAPGSLILRAKALECASLVGMAVGADRFRGDAHAVMALLQQLAAGPMADDDPTASYSLQAG